IPTLIGGGLIPTLIGGGLIPTLIGGGLIPTLIGGGLIPTLIGDRNRRACCLCANVSANEWQTHETEHNHKESERAIIR
uniref:hypothetical protein n=1 Tax=Halorubrum rutilum TaxID=1364933 RepID=UPI0021133BEF